VLCKEVSLELEHCTLFHGYFSVVIGQTLNPLDDPCRNRSLSFLRQPTGSPRSTLFKALHNRSSQSWFLLWGPVYWRSVIFWTLVLLVASYWRREANSRWGPSIVSVCGRNGAVEKTQPSYWLGTMALGTPGNNKSGREKEALTSGKRKGEDGVWGSAS
jgi:hypothetical protein